MSVERVAAVSERRVIRVPAIRPCGDGGNCYIAAVCKRHLITVDIRPVFESGPRPGPAHRLDLPGPPAPLRAQAGPHASVSQSRRTLRLLQFRRVRHPSGIHCSRLCGLSGIESGCAGSPHARFVGPYGDETDPCHPPGGHIRRIWALACFLDKAGSTLYT